MATRRRRWLAGVGASLVVAFGAPGEVRASAGATPSGAFADALGVVVSPPVVPTVAPTPLVFAAGGDFNGDGRADVLVGDPEAQIEGRGAAGHVYVIYGRGDHATLTPPSLDGGGVRIDGPSPMVEKADQYSLPGAQAGASVSAAGDVNGDGLADVIVGAPQASPGLRLNAGAVYVVFGRRDGGPVDLDAPGAGGFGIIGAGPGDAVGSVVGAAGDVNGDGLADILIVFPEPGDDGSDKPRTTQRLAYIVFGKRDAAAVDLRALGPDRGYLIQAPVAFDDQISAVDGGDINGDGRPDTLVTAQNSGVYVVFGQRTGGVVDAGHMRGRGFVVRRPHQRDWPLTAAVPAGDLNDDRRDELLVGMAADSERPQLVRTFVILGGASATAIDLRRVGSRGYAIKGAAGLGSLLTGVGDVNGDGHDDIAVGGESWRDRGQLYVVYGREDSRDVDVRRLGSRGFTVSARANGRSYGNGGGVSSADLNHDRVSDLLVGVPGYDHGCAVDVGAVYVVFGGPHRGKLRLDRLGSAGARLHGSEPASSVGSLVLPGADMTGDGTADALVGVQRVDYWSGWFPRRFVAILPGLPSRLQTTAARSPSSCLGLRAPDGDLGRMVRTGRYAVTVLVRELPPDVRAAKISLYQPVRIPRAPHSDVILPPTQPVLLGSADVQLTPPGIQRVVLRLTRWARSHLRDVHRIHAYVVLDTGYSELDHYTKVTLRRAAERPR